MFWIRSDVYAQDYSRLERLIESDAEYISKMRLNEILRNEFTKVLSANVNGTIGNYLGISTENQALSGAYTIVGDQQVLAFDFSGKVNEGIAGLFEENKFKKGVALGMTFNRFRVGKSSLINYADVVLLQRELRALREQERLYPIAFPEETETVRKEVEKLRKDSTELEKTRSLLYGGRDRPTLDPAQDHRLKASTARLEHEIRLLTYIYKTDSDSLQARSAALDSLKAAKPAPGFRRLAELSLDSIRLIEGLIGLQDSLVAKRRALAETLDEIKENTFSQPKLDATEQRLEIVTLRLGQARAKLADYREGNLLTVKNNEYDDKRRAILDRFNQVRIHHTDLAWFSVGGSLANESYNLLANGTKENAPAVTTQVDLIPTANIALSRYVNRPKDRTDLQNDREVSFITIGAELSYGNNIKDLPLATIQSVDSLGGNRFVSSSQQAYVGEFKTDVLTAEIAFDYYRMAFGSNSAGFHVQSTLNLGPFRPVTSLRGGIVLSATKAGTKTTLANIEIFYGLRDILRTGEKETLLTRNVFGIQTTLPFTF
ncbi:hypothetical protein [Lewinella sp. IMCC34191]|uniref:hypothetical protein n=1 Tax=Lewinella sp. IMCC34191 TaxID=2259172 RepID=UPI000E244FCF|nr:hypothetical protein [Lewinella sp. IMCC34191]